MCVTINFQRPTDDNDNYIDNGDDDDDDNEEFKMETRLKCWWPRRKKEGTEYKDARSVVEMVSIKAGWIAFNNSCITVLDREIPIFEDKPPYFFFF